MEKAAFVHFAGGSQIGQTLKKAMSSAIDAATSFPDDYGYHSFLTTGSILEGALTQGFQDTVRYGGKLQNRGHVLAELAQKTGDQLDYCVANCNELGSSYAKFGYVLIGNAIAGRLNRLAEFDFALKKEIYREVPLASILLEIGSAQDEIRRKLETAFEAQKIELVRIYEATTTGEKKKQKKENSRERHARNRVRGVSTPTYLQQTYKEYFNYQTDLLGFLGTVNSVSYDQGLLVHGYPVLETRKLVRSGTNFTHRLTELVKLWSQREPNIWEPSSNYSTDVSADEREKKNNKSNDADDADDNDDGDDEVDNNKNVNDTSEAEATDDAEEEVQEESTAGASKSGWSSDTPPPTPPPPDSSKQRKEEEEASRKRKRRKEEKSKKSFIEVGAKTYHLRVSLPFYRSDRRRSSWPLPPSSLPCNRESDP